MKQLATEHPMQDRDDLRLVYSGPPVHDSGPSWDRLCDITHALDALMWNDDTGLYIYVNVGWQGRP